MQQLSLAVPQSSRPGPLAAQLWVAIPELEELVLEELVPEELVPEELVPEELVPEELVPLVAELALVVDTPDPPAPPAPILVAAGSAHVAASRMLAMTTIVDEARSML